MILNKEVTLKVNNRTARMYENKGYDIPKYINKHGKICFDTSKCFVVKIEDLDPNSTAKVNTCCDVCKTEAIMPYREYTRLLTGGLRTCIKCKSVKSSKTCMEKYGVKNVSQSDTVKEKVKETNNIRYGVDWCMQNKDIFEKSKKTCLKKYGVEFPLQNIHIKEKAQNTNLEKYGVVNVGQSKEFIEKAHITMIKKYGDYRTMCIPEIRKKIEDTTYKRYGVNHVMSSKCIRDKIVKSKYMNGTISSSKQQRYICNLYSGEQNYPCSKFNLDIKLDDLDIEYDGKGHDLSVTLGNISEHDFNLKEIIRDKIVKSNGYKVMRIISKTDKLPSDDKLLDILLISKNYFSSTTHSWINWYLDDGYYYNAEHKNGVVYDFGKLSKIKSNIY